MPNKSVHLTGVPLRFTPADVIRQTPPQLNFFVSHNLVDIGLEGSYSLQLRTIVTNQKRKCSMRSPRIQRSPLRYPLDDILGTSALVRLIRVLIHDVGGSVSVTDAAKMAGLSTTGARKVLETLEGLGVAVRVGTGRAQKFGPKLGNPYSALLRQLFEMEQKQYEDLIQVLRQAVAMPEI